VQPYDGIIEAVVQPEDALTLDTARHEDRATLVAKGEMDLATRRKFEHEVTRLTEEGASAIEVDMSQVTFIDSAGLGGLLQVRRLGATLTIKDPSERVRRVLDLVLVEGIEGVEVVPR
jgi:anti-sigma B factor antagonist